MKCIETKFFADGILGWADQHFSDFPWRRNRSPYEILVAEFLLKRTTATAVGRIYEDFLIRFPCVQDLAAASEEDLVEYLSGVGLQNQRARSLKRLSTYLITTFASDIPSDLESLLQVPGLGDYSAGAIFSFAFDSPIAVLDVNVERIIVRVFGNDLSPHPSKAVLKEVAHRLMPEENHREYNYGLLDLGRLVCRYANPKCGVCPLGSICDYRANSAEENSGDASSDLMKQSKSKLKTARKQSGISLRRLAEISGVSKLTIIQIESGRTSPRRETLEKLASALRVDPKDLDGRELLVPTPTKGEGARTVAGACSGPTAPPIVGVL